MRSEGGPGLRRDDVFGHVAERETAAWMLGFPGTKSRANLCKYPANTVPSDAFLVAWNTAVEEAFGIAFVHNKHTKSKPLGFWIGLSKQL